MKKDFLVAEHSLYKTWTNMRSRCINIKASNYSNYGGRGIIVCDRWLERNGQGFRNFVLDVGDKPTGKTLDRIDNNGNYEPWNVRWATPTLQNINRRVGSYNRSGYKGVYWHVGRQLWRSQITAYGKHRHLGDFVDKKDAIKARLIAEQTLSIG